MKRCAKFISSVVLSAGMLFATGCGEEAGTPPPEPLAVEKAPATLEEAFASATGELRTLSEESIRLLRAGDYPRALITLERLTARTDLTSSQRGLTSQAMLTANKKVAEAAERGNTDAKKIQQYREFTK